jgi:transposase
MRPHGTAKKLERRRRRAVELLNLGLSLAEVARRLGTTTTSVYRWKQAAAKGGVPALGAKPVPGRPRKLTESHGRRLLKVLDKGAKAHGYPDDRWTLKRVAELIHREFGVEYHHRHVWRLLRRYGWTHRAPSRRSAVPHEGTDRGQRVPGANQALKKGHGGVGMVRAAALLD